MLSTDKAESLRADYLLPAMQEAFSEYERYQVTPTIRNAKYHSRQDNGKFTAGKPFFVRPQELNRFSYVLREKVGANSEFTDFFFVVNGNGFKIPLHHPLNFNDINVKFNHLLDFSLIDKIYYDVAWNFISSNNTLLWSVSDPNVTIKHRSMIDKFLSRSCIAKNYRLDRFTGLNSIAGCAHKTSYLSSGDNGVMKLQAYHTIKALFYNRTRNLRHGLDMDSSVLLHRAYPYKAYFVSFILV